MTDSVEEIKDKIEIASLIGGYVDLKKAGKNFKGLCPFHSEKTPSFTVSNEIQRYKCFGCGESGDIFTFLEKYEGMDFFEALTFLADKAGVKLETANFDKKNYKDRLFKINEVVSKFYSYILTKHPAGQIALKYLEGRGINLPEIQKFKIGFSPGNQPLAIKKFVIERNKISVSDLQELGIIYQTERGPVDRFKGRIIFPLADHRGNIIGFAGRILPEFDNGRTGKYINSPETPLYHKSSVLYGLDTTKSDIKKTNKAVIVEGELDMISSWKAGIKNIVAIKGTALTTEQIKLVSRYGQELILALDADSAGSNASRRGIEIAEKEGVTVKVAVLEKYKDPDEAARSDPEYLKNCIENPTGIWDFLIDMETKNVDNPTGTDVVRLSRSLVPILNSINDKIVQAHYIEVVARKLNVDSSAVARQLGEGKNEAVNQVEDQTTGTKKKDRKTQLEERLIALMLEYAPDKLLKKGVHRYFLSPFAKRLYEEFLSFRQKYKKFEVDGFTKFLPAELTEGYSDLVLETGDKFDDKFSFEVEYKVIIHELKEITYRDKMKKLSVQIFESEKQNDSDRLAVLKQKFQKVAKKLSKLEELKSKGIILS
jgi:DNA primase